MKLVREHINEKFTEKSDPIQDMEIGNQAMSDLGEKFFKKIEKKYGGNPSQFIWNCLFLLDSDNDKIGFVYKMGDELYYYAYFDNPEKIHKTRDLEQFLLKHKYKDQQILKSFLSKMKTFKWIMPLHEKFEEHGDPIHQMGIGDKGLIIKKTFEKLAKENGYKSYTTAHFTDADDIEKYGFKNAKLIESWYKEGEENFREITLYSYDDRETGEKRYGIFECEEEAESGGDELSWPDGIEFTDDYWKRNIN